MRPSVRLEAWWAPGPLGPATRIGRRGRDEARRGKRTAPSLAQTGKTTIVYGRGQTLFARRAREKVKSVDGGQGGWLWLVGMWNWQCRNKRKQNKKKKPTSSRTRRREQGRGRYSESKVGRLINSVRTGMGPRRGRCVRLYVPMYCVCMCVCTAVYVQGRGRNRPGLE